MDYKDQVVETMRDLGIVASRHPTIYDEIPLDHFEVGFREETSTSPKETALALDGPYFLGFLSDGVFIPLGTNSFHVYQSQKGVILGERIDSSEKVTGLEEVAKEAFVRKIASPLRLKYAVK